MYQIFQDNIKICLKYDGERKNNLFTVMIIDKDDLKIRYQEIPIFHTRYCKC
jgi:hypothetical protein